MKITEEEILREAENSYFDPYRLAPFDPNSFIEGANWAISQMEQDDQSRWISCEERLPEIIKGKNYSKNVLAWCDDELKVMCLCYVDSMDFSGYLWANCYGDINGDGEIDDEYFPTHWQLIEPPKQ